jgi:transmembrane 9 superfamily protein 3
MDHFHSEGFGETILGYDLIASAIPIAFGEDKEPTIICAKSFTDKELEQMRYAVTHEFWYQLFLDDLPIWGMVGEGTDNIFTHSRLEIGYNEDRVLQVHLTSENPKSLSKLGGGGLKFSYEVNGECDFFFTLCICSLYSLQVENVRLIP